MKTCGKITPIYNVLINSCETFRLCLDKFEMQLSLGTAVTFLHCKHMQWIHLRTNLQERFLSHDALLYAIRSLKFKRPVMIFKMQVDEKG